MAEPSKNTGMSREVKAGLMATGAFGALLAGVMAKKYIAPEELLGHKPATQQASYEFPDKPDSESKEVDTKAVASAEKAAPAPEADPIAKALANARASDVMLASAQDKGTTGDKEKGMVTPLTPSGGGLPPLPSLPGASSSTPPPMPAPTPPGGAAGGLPPLPALPAGGSSASSTPPLPAPASPAGAAGGLPPLPALPASGSMASPPPPLPATSSSAGGLPPLPAIPAGGSSSTPPAPAAISGSPGTTAVGLPALPSAPAGLPAAPRGSGEPAGLPPLPAASSAIPPSPAPPTAPGVPSSPTGTGGLPPLSPLPGSGLPAPSLPPQGNGFPANEARVITFPAGQGPAKRTEFIPAPEGSAPSPLPAGPSPSGLPAVPATPPAMSLGSPPSGLPAPISTAGLSAPQPKSLVSPAPISSEIVNRPIPVLTMPGSPSAPVDKPATASVPVLATAAAVPAALAVGNIAPAGAIAPAPTNPAPSPATGGLISPSGITLTPGAPVGQPTIPTPARPKVSSWSESVHVARPGDTYGTLAAEYYRDGSLGNALASYNRLHPRAREDAPRNGALVPGMEVYLPDRAALNAGASGVVAPPGFKP